MGVVDHSRGIALACAGLAALYAAYAHSLLRQERKRREKAEQNRAHERRGRISAERTLREKAVARMCEQGYPMRPIAVVRSCFPDRRGTPRQGLLASGAKARIECNDLVQSTAVEALEGFSHVWVVFVFHENTNLGKDSSRVPAKVRPPRLNGARVGLFSTRTPSRPNPIGLSVVKLEAVLPGGKGKGKGKGKGRGGAKWNGHSGGPVLEISGHDLVDGTPVLDVKPYIPYDSVPEATVPAWVLPESTAPAKVSFAPVAVQQLDAIAARGALRFYASGHEVRAAVAQLLSHDIRSLHQRKLHQGAQGTKGATKAATAATAATRAMATQGENLAGPETTAEAMFKLRLDVLELTYFWESHGECGGGAGGGSVCVTAVAELVDT